MIQPLLWVPARTVWGEARGEGPAGIAAVAHVLVNRLADGRWGASLNSVCLWDWQFSCWNQGDPNRPQMVALSDNDPMLMECAQAVDDAMSGMADPTGGATHYYAPREGVYPPSWTIVATMTVHIGHQIFFKNVK